MDDSNIEKEHDKAQKKCDLKEKTSSVQEINLDKNGKELSLLTGSILKESNNDEKKEKEIVIQSMEASTANDQPTTSLNNVEPTTLLIRESKSSSLRNKAKRPKSKENSHKSDNDSDQDSVKIQKLDESQSNTSTDNPQESNIETDSSFLKLESKFKRRNYRSHSNPSDIIEDSSDHSSSHESIHDESSSSDSDVIQQFSGRRFTDTSDEGSEASEGNDSSDGRTTVSEDDADEIPAVLQKEPSKCNWCSVRDVINRQIGFNNSIQSRFYSSLHAVQRLELKYKLKEHNGCVNALAFNQKGNLLVSGSDDLTVTIWNWAIGKKHVVLQSGHHSNIYQSKWLPLDMECFVVTCANDGQVRLINVLTGVTRTLAHHGYACREISTHLDLPHNVLSAGEDAKVLSIDVRENRPTKLLTVKDNDMEVQLCSIHSNPLNSCEFCVAGRSRSVKIYDRRKPATPIQQISLKHLLAEDIYVEVTSAIYNHNGTEILASCSNEDIYLFDTTSAYQNGDYAHRYQGHRNSATVKRVNFFGPNSEFVISGSDCGNIFVWDKKTEAIVQWMPGDKKGIVNVLEPHPHYPILATSGLDYDVKVWIPSCTKTPVIREKLQYCVMKNLKYRTERMLLPELDSYILSTMQRIDMQQFLTGFLANPSDIPDTENDTDNNDSDADDSSFNASNSQDSANESSS